MLYAKEATYVKKFRVSRLAPLHSDSYVGFAGSGAHCPGRWASVHRKRAFLCTVTAMLGSLVLVPIAQGDGPLYTANERFGVGVSRNVPYTISDYDLSGLRIGWYSDWTFSATPSTPGGIEYAQLISVREGNLAGSPAAIAAAASANPGANMLQPTIRPTR